MRQITDQTPLLSPLFADGRHFLTLGALGLLFSGGFALFLSATGQFLPHDTLFLGMTARQLCEGNGCRIVHFMIHDRVSFGGTLVALAVLYLWLVHFPLRQIRPWAWWVLFLSNLSGFASFLTYLGFGYLDTWHAVATVVLLPCFVAGFGLTWRTLPRPRGVGSLLRPGVPIDFRTPPGVGRVLLLACSAGMLAAGITISVVGMTVVFVPQDLEYMGTTADALNALNPRLIPLIAHDRAGFGAGVFNVGFLFLAAVWCGSPSRHLWQALAVAGMVGFATAIAVHPLVGYNNPVHLAPAVLAAATFFAALALTAPRMLRGKTSPVAKYSGNASPPAGDP